MPPPAGSELGGLALHDFALIVLGVQLIDDTNLEALAADGRLREALGVPADGGAAAGHQWHRFPAQSDCGVLKLKASSAQETVT